MAKRSFAAWVRQLQSLSGFKRPVDGKLLFPRARLGVERLETRYLMDVGLGQSGQAFVANLYHDLLHRVPSALEVDSWTAALRAGASASSVAAAFLASPEYRVNLVDTAYRDVLGRDPEPAGQQAWLVGLAAGLDETHLRAGVAQSAEALVRPGGDPSAWIGGLYREVLGRDAETAGRDDWLRGWHLGSTPAQIARGFADSPEARAHFVITAYDELLGRAPEPAGLASWSAALAAGATGTEVLARIAGSAEYLGKNAAGGSLGLGPTQPASGGGSPIGVRSSGSNGPLSGNAPNFTAVEGTSFSGVVATFSDSELGDSTDVYSVSINWGDGTTSSAGTVTGTYPNFQVHGSHTYAEEKTYTVTIAITDPDASSTTGNGPQQGPLAPIGGGGGGTPGVTLTLTCTATVSDAPLTVTVSSVTNPEGGSFSGPVATFSDPNSHDAPSTYVATVNWGDGTSGGGTVTGSGGSYAVSGSHAYAGEEGTTRTITVTVQDKDATGTGTGTGSASGTATVVDPPPSVSVPGFALTEGGTFSGNVATFTDPHATDAASTYLASVAWGDGSTTNGTVSGASGSFSVAGAHAYSEDGNYAVSVTVQDKDATGTGTGVGVGNGTAVVTDPALTGVTGGVIAVSEGTTFSGAVATFSDPHPDPATSYRATITWGDGATSSGTVVNGTPAGTYTVNGSHLYAEDGSYAVTVTIQDADLGLSGGGTGASVTANFTATVTDPALTSVAGVALALQESQAFTGTVATFSDPHPDPASAYQAVITWGDGATSTGTVSSGTGGSYVVAGTHTFAEEGSFATSVAIQDADLGLGGGGTGAAAVTATGTATVADAPLSAAGAVTLTGLAGAPLSNLVVAQFRDADPAGTLTDYSAVIAWGDGTTSAGQISASTSGSWAYSVTASHRFELAGTYAVQVTIQDAGGSTVAVGDAAQVTAPGPLTITTSTLNLTEGAAAGTLPLATFNDSDGNASAGSYTAVIHWGDGQTSPGSVSAAGPAGRFQISGNHAYAEEGSFQVSVVLSDSDGGSITAADTAFVADAPLSPVAAGGSSSATVGAPFSGSLGTFTDADPAGIASDFQVVIDWGDGSAPGLGTVQGNSPFSVSGTHAYEKTGSFSVVATVVDQGGAQAILTGTVVVSAAGLTVTAASPTLVEGANPGAVLATLTDPDGNTDPSRYSATLSWGDGTASSSATVQAAPGGGLEVTDGHAFDEEGSFSFTVTVTDLDGTSASSEGTATVADAALAVTANALNATNNASYSGVVGTFTDADPAGTITDYTAVVDWGDETAPSAGVITPKAGGGFQVEADHAYTSAGSYTTTLTILDLGGSTAEASATTTITAATQPVTVSDISLTEGETFSGTLATYVPGTPDPGAAALAVTIGWGDGAESTGSLASNGSGGYTISGTHTFAEETDFPGTVVVTVRNTQDPSATPQIGTGMVTVADAPLTPTGLTLTGWTGIATDSPVVGEFHDANTLAPVSDFTATINWGDGSSTSAGEVVAATGAGNFQVVGDHAYAAAQNYTITVTVTDDGGQSTTITSSLAVAVDTTVVNLTEGLPFDGVLATFTGDPSQVESADITWHHQNGTNSSTQTDRIQATGPNSFTVLGTFAASPDETNDPQNGGVPDSITVTVTLFSGVTLSESGPILVNDAALTAVSGLNFTGTVGRPLASGEGGAVTARFTDANPNAPTSDFAATIDWGDGTTSDGTVTSDGHGGFQVAGSHTYVSEGVYTIETKVVDDGGSTVSVTGTANMTQIVEGQDFTLALPVSPPASGTTDTAGTQYMANIAWGDGETSVGDVTPLMSANGTVTQLQVTADHTFHEEGTYAVTVTVEDALANAVTASTAITVVDAPLSAWGLDVSGHAGESTGQVVVGEFFDDNLGAAQFDFTGTDYTATITWGDGSSSAGTVQATGDNDFEVLGSHTYTSAGTYGTAIAVVDEGGERANAQGQANIDGGQNGNNGWNLTGDARTGGGNDSSGAFLLPLGEATVDLNQGALRLSHALDFDQSPGTDVGGNPALIYNSATVNVRPIVQLSLDSDPTGEMADEAEVVLTWNGTAQTPVTYDLSEETPGATIDLSTQLANPVSASGAYAWSVTVTLTFADSTTQALTTSGEAFVVARDGSPYGAGWWIDGLSQLVVGSAGALMVTGAGDSLYFASAGANAYTSPPEDFGTLVKNGDGSFTYTAKDQTLLQFDSQGNLRQVVDTHGLARTYIYGAANNLEQVATIDGGFAQLTYDPGSNLLAAITEPGNRDLLIQIDGSGDLTQITDVDQTMRNFGYDGTHHLVTDRWDPLAATFTYDPTTGLLTGVDRGLGTTYAIVSAAASGLGQPAVGPQEATVTDALLHTTSYLLDERGRLLVQVLPLGETTAYERNAAGLVTLQVDGRGLPTQYQYNGGDLVSVTAADGSTTQYQYDPTFHHLVQTTDPDGIVSVVNTYDPLNGDLLTSTDAMGNKTTYLWANGLLVSTTDANRHTSSTIYDGARRPFLTFDNLMVPTLYRYDPNGNPLFTLTFQSLRQLQLTQTQYSPRNRLIQTVDAGGGVTTDTYNAYGQLTAETNPRGFTSSTVYDQRGLVFTSTDGNGKTTQDFYDLAGRLHETLDPKKNSTTYQYDFDDRRVGVTDGEQNTTATHYDGDSNVVGTTDALGKESMTVYDALNRPEATVDAMGRATETLYDAVGDVLRFTTADGSTNTYYDFARRPFAAVDPRGLLTLRLYDGVGNVTASRDGAGGWTLTGYDADNRPTVTVDPKGIRTSTGYDLAGNAIRRVDGRGKVWATGYDLLDRPSVFSDPIEPVADTTVTVHDGQGNAVATRDARGHWAFSGYDGDDRPLWHQDEAGFIRSTAYDDAGAVESSRDATGGLTQVLVFDGDDRPLLTLNADGQLALVHYNPVGAVDASMDGAGQLTQTAYNGDGEVEAVRNPAGGVTQTAYGANGRVAATLDPDQVETAYAYDADGNPLATVDNLGYQTITLHDGDNRPYLTFDPVGQLHVTSYDPDSQVQAQALYSNTGQLVNLVQYAYDNAGNQTGMVDGDGNLTVNGYDDAGRQTSERVYGPGVQVATTSLAFQLDPNGNVTVTTDGDGNTIQDTYDADNRVSLEQAYAANGTLIASDSKLYNGNGDVTEETDADQNVIVSTYTHAGLLQTQQVFAPGANLPTRSITNLYDGADRLQVTSDGDGNVTVNTYTNPLGGGSQVKTQLFAPNNLLVPVATTVATYDAAGLLANQVDANGNVTAYGYDGDERQTAVTVGAGTQAAATTVTLLDGLDRAFAVIDPDRNATLTTYADVAGGTVTTTTDALGHTTTDYGDPNGNLVSETNRNGLTRTFTYTATGQVQTETWYAANGTVVNVKAYHYDPAGNLLTASDNAGTYTFTYLDNRVATQTDPNGITLTYGHDGNGNVTSGTDSQGGVVASAYDELGNLRARSLSSGLGQARVDLTHDPNSNLTGVLRWGDTAATQLKGTSTLVSDAENNLTSLVHHNAANAVLASYGYGHDAGGRLTSETDNNVTTAYTYDATNQLTQAGATAYHWDANGNSLASLTGPNNRLLRDGTWTYGYDPEGNLVAKTGLSNGLTWTYGYDNVNQMTSAVETSAGQTVLQAVYTYDVFGNRIQSSVTSGGTTTTTRYAYDGGTLYADLNSGGTIQTRYLSGDGADQWFARIDGSGTNWLLTDHLGSVRDVMNSAGVVTDHLDYNAFGGITLETNPANGGRLKYAGYEWDVALGLYHAGARYYDPASGKWTTQDPSGFGGGDSNLQRYAGNGPTDGTDPSGNFLVTNAESSIGPISDDLASYGITGNWIRLDHWFSADRWGFVPTVASNAKAIQLANGSGDMAGYFKAVADITGSYNIEDGGRSYGGTTLSEGERGALTHWFHAYADGDKYTAHSEPSIAGQYLRAAGEGISDGAVIVSDRLTAGLIPDLHAESERLIKENGGLYELSAAMGDVAREALLTAATGGALSAAGKVAGQVVTKVGGPLIKLLLTEAQVTRAACVAGSAAKVVGTGLQVQSVVAQTDQIITSAASAKAAYDRGDMPGMVRALGSTGIQGLGLASTLGDLAETFKTIKKDGLLAFLTSCFAAGTPLRTPQGHKPVEEFQPGDAILSRSESNPDGPVAVQVVEAVFVRTGRIVNVHVHDQVIRTTAEHPFYVYNRGWVSAAALAVGDWLLGLEGQWTAVGEVLDTGEYERVYNLCVADHHTYFVGSEEWGFSVWAHNSNLCVDGSFFGKTPERVREATPKGWSQRRAASGHGWVLVDENGAERVRYMYPAKDGKFHHETTGYFRRNDAAGNFLDVDGKVVDPADPLFHVKTHIIPSGVK